jgi:hypothetical protein
MPLALCLSLVLLFSVAAPATANEAQGDITPQSYDVWHGYTPCTNGDWLDVHSFASGQVAHFVDGMWVGTWYNGSMTFMNVAGGPSVHGYWTVDSWYGWISSAYGVCYDTGGGDDGGGDDGGGDDGGGDDGGGDDQDPPDLPPRDPECDDPTVRICLEEPYSVDPSVNR